jgi:hypothetical protein
VAQLRLRVGSKCAIATLHSATQIVTLFFVELVVNDRVVQVQAIPLDRDYIILGRDALQNTELVVDFATKQFSLRAK